MRGRPLEPAREIARAVATLGPEADAQWHLQGRTVILAHHAGKSGQQRGTSKREDIKGMLNYEATVIDPKTWVRPWTILIQLQKDNKYQFLEYACHEGNYAMEDILSGARALEAEKNKK